MSKTKIDWATDVWNPVTGCTPAGAGCANCYAKGIAKRFWGDRKFSEVQCHDDRLDQPLRWRKPRTIFVNSMGDLFHKDVPSGFIARVIDNIERSYWHRFIVLTKRPERAKDVADCWGTGYPKNLILGVSCSTQSEVDRAVPILLDTPAACRCVSLEPLLGPVSLQIEDEETGTLYNALTGEFSGNDERGPRLDWVIVGGETGKNARPMHPDWVRTVRDQCGAAGTSFFFKQWGEWNGEVSRVGKARAGHMLDGRAHREVPEVLK